MMTAFTMIVAHPIVQARIQAEMDLVIGRDRLPEFSDKPGLPYLQCVILEVIRFVRPFRRGMTSANMVNIDGVLPLL